MKQWTFTTILYVDHDAAFETALTKLKANDGFDKEVQLLVMDPHASEEVAQLCQGQANVRHCPMEDAEIGAAYNEGLRQAEGTYVNFCLATAEYSGNIYKKVSVSPPICFPVSPPCATSWVNWCPTAAAHSPRKRIRWSVWT